MAKGKTKSGVSKTSKHSMRSISRIDRMRHGDRHYIDHLLNKWDAFLAGKKVYETVQNPNPQETNKKFIRVEMKQLYGDFRRYR